MNEEGKFMVVTGAVLESRKTKKILLLKRSGRAVSLPGVWDEPMGRMKNGELPEEGMRREIYEESGIKNFDIIKPLRVFHFYRGEEKLVENETVGIVYWCKTDEEDVIISDEHEDFGWFSPQEALKLVEHPGIREDIEVFIKERQVLEKPE